MLEIIPEVLDKIQRIYGSMWPRCLYCTDKNYETYIVFDVTGDWAVHSCERCIKKQCIFTYKILSIKEIFYLNILGIK